MNRYSKKRYLNIELLKAVGIIYLIILHQIIWLFIKEDAGGLLYQEANDFVLGFAAHSGLHVLGFQVPLLAGITFYLVFKNKKMTWKIVFQRSFILCALGFFMNVLSWGLPDIFDWDVLQFIALSMILTYLFLKKLPEPWALSCLMTLGIVMLCCSEFFPSGRFIPSYLYIIIFGDLSAEHYWPLCPWFVLFAAGTVLGFYLHNKKKKNLQLLTFLGIPLFLVSLCSGRFFPEGQVHNAWGPHLFSPSPFFVIGILGFSLITIPGSFWLFERSPEIKNILQRSILPYYGQGILWIYLLTTVIGYRITLLFIDNMNLNFRASMILLPFLIIGHLMFAYGIGRLVNKGKTGEYS